MKQVQLTLIICLIQYIEKVILTYNKYKEISKTFYILFSTKSSKSGIWFIRAYFHLV